MSRNCYETIIGIYLIEKFSEFYNRQNKKYIIAVQYSWHIN